MFFRKNKIKMSIDNNAAQSVPTDSEFESLSSVKKYQKDKRFWNRCVVQQFKDGRENIKNKYNSVIQYSKTNYYRIFLLSFIVMFLVAYTLVSIMALSPWVVVPNGDWRTLISNFYVGYNGHVVSISTTAITFIVFFALSLIFLILVFISKKGHSLIVKTNTLTKVFSIIGYILFFGSFIIVLVICLVPPPIFSSLGAQGFWDRVTALDALISDTNVSDVVKVEKIRELNNYIASNPSLKVNLILIDPDNAKTIENCSNWLTNSKYLVQYNNNAPTLMYDTTLGSGNFTLTTAGIIIIVFFTILGAFGLFIIPFVLYCIYTIHEIKFNELSEDIQENWNLLKKILYVCSTRVKDASYKKLKKVKNRKSFAKYKRELEEKGMRTKSDNNDFSSDSADKIVTKAGLTMEEITKNPANIAFLSKEGKWMYHDGNNNVFIARGDEWIPYDVNQEIHKAHANVVHEDLNLSPSAKKAKESKFSLFGKKKESNIALPDDEIDAIVKSLDI